MQKCKLERLPIEDVIRGLERSLNTFPVVPRDCVHALNIMVYNLQERELSPEAYKQIVFLVLRGFTSEDVYLKNYIYALLIDLGRRTRDGILAINCMLKEMDGKQSTERVRSTALRALFATLPETMRYDFEKYVRSELLNGSDNAVVVAAEYFPSLAVPSRVRGDISDFHQAFFNTLPVNKYSAMASMNKLEMANIVKYLRSNDTVVVLEAAKCIAGMRPEKIAPHVDEVVNGLIQLLSGDDTEQYAAAKVLAELSQVFPTKVARANSSLEELVHSSCGVVSVLAILILLRTGDSNTAGQLAARLEPLMQTMSYAHRRMAIDTMEKLALRGVGGVSEYGRFIRRALVEKGDLGFKKYLVGKLGALFNSNLSSSVYAPVNDEIMHFLCGYLEDPEHYQISMDVLGIIGRHLPSGANGNANELVHIYNRLVLDNAHVRKCAIQTVYDLASPEPLEGRLAGLVGTFCDEETERMCTLLAACTDLPRGEFSLAELDLAGLGDIREDIMKYVETPEMVQEEIADGFIKECRPIKLTPEDGDVYISLVKKVSTDSITLCFTVINNMQRLLISSGLLSLECGELKIQKELEEGDFVENKATLEITVDSAEERAVYGIFEYQVRMEDDKEDTEEDSISIEPFAITVLDLVKPGVVSVVPPVENSLELAMCCSAEEAASRVIEAANMLLVAGDDGFRLTGTYKGSPVVIEAVISQENTTLVSMVIRGETKELVDGIVSVFE